MNDILKQKTTWAGLVGLVLAAQGYFTGSMSPAEAIQLAVASIIGIFMRQAIKKEK